MARQKTYPDINGMNYADACAALKLARVNFDSVAEEHREELLRRITALENRRDRLYKTQRNIDRATLALGAKIAAAKKRAAAVEPVLIDGDESEDLAEVLDRMEAERNPITGDAGIDTIFHAWNRKGGRR